MIIVHPGEIEPQQVQEPGADKVSVQVLLARPQGAPNFAMRLFELAPGGHTPQHTHTWEHEVYMLEGEVEVAGDDGPQSLSAGDALLVRPNEPHQFRNRAPTNARFLCVIPLAS